MPRRPRGSNAGEGVPGARTVALTARGNGVIAAAQRVSAAEMAVPKNDPDNIIFMLEVEACDFTMVGLMVKALEHGELRDLVDGGSDSLTIVNVRSSDPLPTPSRVLGASLTAGFVDLAGEDIGRHRHR